MAISIQQNGRIENQNGIRFYEQDAIMCSYVYTNDIKIDVSLDYRNSGFGIIFAEYNSKSMLNSSNDIKLLRIGDLEWSLVQIKNNEQRTLYKGGSPIRSTYNEENIIKITVRKIGRQMRLYADGKEISRMSIKQDLVKYKIGFYSNYGNTIISSNIFEYRPMPWFTNVENSNGGRVSFKRDTIIFENGDKSLETEQQKIKLKAGKYWLSFNTKKINDELDIKYFLFPSKYEKLEISPEKKSILDYKDNSFVLESDEEVNILFQCKSGEVSNISIKDDINQSYVSNSGDKPLTKEGSKVIVHLENIKKIRWNGCVEYVPKYNISDELPYHIIKYGNSRYTYTALSMDLKHEYSFSFYRSDDKKSWTLNIADGNNNIFLNTFTAVEKTMEFFYNITGYAKDIIITLNDGTEINVLLQKSYKKYIPIEIESPVIVTDENYIPFDLSSDYRFDTKNNKYIFTNWGREYFNGNSNKLFTEKNILNDSDTVVLFGIKDDMNEDFLYDISDSKIIHDISPKCSSKYDIIASEYYNVLSDCVELSETITDKGYKYYVVDYMKDNSYCINVAKDNNDNDIYEVDISTDDEKFITFYDMAKNGQIRHYKIIDNINPVDDYFISATMREVGEVFENISI